MTSKSKREICNIKKCQNYKDTNNCILFDDAKKCKIHNNSKNIEDSNLYKIEIGNLTKEVYDKMIKLLKDHNFIEVEK